jgi:cytoskeletal protein CcmA (bactofilin family)
VVEGVIIAEVLSIRGKFDGAIRAKNLNIAAKAKITGTIEYDLLSVEDGACIDGQFKRLEK